MGKIGALFGMAASVAATAFGAASGRTWMAQNGVRNFQKFQKEFNVADNNTKNNNSKK